MKTFEGETLLWVKTGHTLKLTDNVSKIQVELWGGEELVVSKWPPSIGRPAVWARGQWWSASAEALREHCRLPGERPTCWERLYDDDGIVDSYDKAPEGWPETLTCWEL